MAGGGKGGSSTTSVQLPKFIEDAAQRAVAQGEQAGQIGFVPFSGPDVAAFSPMQEAAFAGTNQAASAFGLPTSEGTGLPEAETFAGGIRGFSSAPLFEQALAQLEESRPGQFNAITDFFIDPVTGALPQGAAQQRAQQEALLAGGGLLDPRTGQDADQTAGRSGTTGFSGAGPLGGNIGPTQPEDGGFFGGGLLGGLF